MNAASALRSFRRLLPALRPEWRGMVGSYLVGTASALGLAAIAVLTAWAVGHAVAERRWPDPAWWVLVVGLVLLRTLLTWREMDVSHSLAYRVLARLRMALFDAYARSVPARRHEHSGRAAATAMGDIEKLEFFYAHTIAQLGSSLTVFAVALLTTTMLLPEAALVVAAGGAIVTTTSLYGARAIRRAGAGEQREREELSARIVDAFAGLREVLGYGLAPRIVADADAATRRATAVARRRELLTQLIAGARELIVTAVVIGVIAVGAAAAGIIAGAGGSRLSPAVLPALVALAVAGVTAVADATTTLTQIHPLTAGAERVGTAIARPPVVTVPGDPVPVPGGPLGLRFRDVSFSYDDAQPTLVAWSAELAPSEHVGLAGSSGAGKSTLIALAARLWDPSAGAVELVGADGTATPIAGLDDASFRAAVALVEQDARLFHGTLRDNLLRGTDPRPDAELTAVLDRVGATGWIALDDELGEGGLRLSGGQQARLCLARALVRRPRILLVDEVTASLDPDTERAVSDVIAAFDGTVLMASHRQQTLARVHRVVRVDRTAPGAAPPQDVEGGRTVVWR
ncbi:ATP-binding cassette domain-containing protein [Jiangella endophytica]|uniref:ATP-binding cassette domain-containing protein n=1 Tax=Jiangella endophytica TaxID=1623398 RepID=UPI000E35247E|nr:ABC transporter ATP-binding protein [Jiangella endophytica]